jgi:hypothetical protein
LIAARPSETYPLSDTVFVFLALELRPTGLTTRQAVSLWRDYEQNLGLRDNNYGFVRQPFDSRNSHEQAGLCDTLQRETAKAGQLGTPTISPE